MASRIGRTISGEAGHGYLIVLPEPVQVLQLYASRDSLWWLQFHGPGEIPNGPPATTPRPLPGGVTDWLAYGLDPWPLQLGADIDLEGTGTEWPTAEALRETAPDFDRWRRAEDRRESSPTRPATIAAISAFCEATGTFKVIVDG
jgi:hypothetical protein